MPENKQTICLIARSERVGDSWVRAMLRASGRLAGAASIDSPREAFQRSHFPGWWQNRGNWPWIGVSLLPWTLSHFLKLMARTPDRLAEVRVLWLRRLDKRRQAISLYRAQESRLRVLWRDHPVWPGLVAAHREVAFDPARLDACRLVVEAQDRQIKDMLEHHEIKPMIFEYEELCDSPHCAMDQIAYHFRLPDPPFGKSPLWWDVDVTHCLEDEITRQWLEDWTP